jgi:hypothetical protein
MRDHTKRPEGERLNADPCIVVGGSAHGLWLRQLCDRAREWVKRTSIVNLTPTNAYGDLTFAFWLASLGENNDSGQLMERARAALVQSKDEVHDFLSRAYTYRISQAREGKPHRGPLPLDLLQILARLDRMPRYNVDRLRQHSRILEPDGGVDPYSVWGARISKLDKTLCELREMTDGREMAQRVDRLLAEVPEKDGLRQQGEIRASILRVALDLAPRITEDFGRTMIRLTQETLDALPATTDHRILWDAALVRQALSVAAAYKIGEAVPSFAGWVRRTVASVGTEQRPLVVQWLAESCIVAFAAVGMRVALEQFLTDLERELQIGEDANALAGHPPYRRSVVRAWQDVAAGWYAVGQDKKAEPAVEAARVLLFKNELRWNKLRCREQTDLACAYARTLGYAPAALAQGHLEELFSRLEGVRDTFTTNSHYSLSHLDVIEAVVLSVVHNVRRSIVA